MSSPEEIKPTKAPRGTRRSWLGRIAGSFMGILASLAVIFVGGFLLFATGIPRVETPPPRLRGSRPTCALTGQSPGRM